MSLWVLDAGVVIGFSDPGDPHHEDAVTALTRLASRGDELAMSTATLSEVLVGPARVSPARLRAFAAMVRELVSGHFIAVDENSAQDIAQTRATYPQLKLPDAAVVAAAHASRAERILTTDTDFNVVPGALQLDEFVDSLEMR